MFQHTQCFRAEEQKIKTSQLYKIVGDWIFVCLEKHGELILVHATLFVLTFASSMNNYMCWKALFVTASYKINNSFWLQNLLPTQKLQKALFLLKLFCFRHLITTQKCYQCVNFSSTHHLDALLQILFSKSRRILILQKCSVTFKYVEATKIQ
jgi:hypothetical protein